MMRWLAVAVVAAASVQGETDLERARRVLKETVVVDSHIDTIQRVLIEGVDLGKRLADGHVDLARLEEGCVRAPFFALWVPTYYKDGEAVRRVLQLRDAFTRMAAANSGKIALALDAAGVERIAREGRIAAVLTVEGGHAIASDLGVLRTFHELGVRSMTLTHFKANEWADASTSPPVHNGLTAFGKQVVREMNRLGMIVDVSHVSDKTFHDVLEVSTKPVMASHSSCRALSDVPRNMSDAMIRALARKGGVIAINFGEGFLHPKDAEKLKRAIAGNAAREPALTGRALDAYAAKRHLASPGAPKTHATIADAVAHIDHAVRLAGADHVGIGSDFDGISAPPKGLEHIGKIPALAAALLAKGYSETDVKKIFGGNQLRVLREVTGR